MMSDNSNRKYKKPKDKTRGTTNPSASRSPTTSVTNPDEIGEAFPLVAKDSEWVGLNLPRQDDNGDESEQILQLIDVEEGPELKPLAMMFPKLLQRDPDTVHGVLSQQMSTIEVTKHLVELGEKPDKKFLKQSDKIIPRDKRWLDDLPEETMSVEFLEDASSVTSCEIRDEVNEGTSQNKSSKTKKLSH